MADIFDDAAVARPAVAGDIFDDVAGARKTSPAAPVTAAPPTPVTPASVNIPPAAVAPPVPPPVGSLALSGIRGGPPAERIANVAEAAPGIVERIRKFFVGPKTMLGQHTTPSEAEEFGRAIEQQKQRLETGDLVLSPYGAEFGSPELLRAQARLMRRIVGSPPVAPSEFISGDYPGSGVATGVVEFGESLLSPENVAIMGVTKGFGLGAKAATGIPLLKSAVVRYGPRAVSLAFAAQMAANEPELLRQVTDAYERGDKNEVERLMTHYVLTGGLAYLVGRHGIVGEPAKPGEQPKPTVETKSAAEAPAVATGAPAVGPVHGGDIFDVVAEEVATPGAELPAAGTPAPGEAVSPAASAGVDRDMPRQPIAAATHVAPKEPGTPVSALTDEELLSIDELRKRLTERGITNLSRDEARKLFETPPASSAEVAAPHEDIFDVVAGKEAARGPEPPGSSAKRGETVLYSGVDPGAGIEAARVLQRAWEDRIAKPFADRVLKIGDKYVKAREADPEVAEGLHLLDNAPGYLRAKALQEVRNVVGDLSRPQERLFTLMADAEARENLRVNHPKEFHEAENDPAVQGALARYRPLEQEVTRLREKMGGAILDQDYLRRVYEEHVAGVNKPEAAKDSERATSAFDRVIRPQRMDKFSREAEAEYHYQNGLHELGPAFATKFIATHLRALRDQVAREFLGRATKLAAGAPEPRSIEYNGKLYFSPDVAREMREAGQRGVLEYGRYDPTAGEKFPTPVDGKFLGPRELTKALTDFGRRDESEPGALRRFFQEQVIGFGFGIPHVFNILRRVSQSVPGGQANPEGWVHAWNVALDRGLRERGMAGLNDPGFDMLAQRGSISTGEVANLRRYVGGNLNPANWARTVAKIGHKLLFEPESASGFGGLDQRARLYIADLVHSQRPDLTDSEIAAAVRTQLGDYNRANWTDRQKMLGRFMMWPGWDFASLRWVLQHPVRTTVPPALMILLANKAVGMFGANREEDRDDIGAIHVGDRDYSPSLLRESTARNLFRPVLAYAQSRIRGEGNARALDQAARGVTAGGAGVLTMLRPDLSGFLALATNRHQLVTGREIVGREDYDTPGQILPSKALEQQAAFTVRHAVPALDRMLDSGDQDIDLRSFVGGNLGLPNYRDDAEKRLLRNTAEAERVYFSVSQLAKTKPEAARAMLRDPDNATFALFHRDLAQMASVLHQVDQAKKAVEGSRLPAEEKEKRLAAIDDARRNLLEHADGLNSVLFQRRKQARAAGPPRPGSLASAVEGRR